MKKEHYMQLKLDLISEGYGGELEWIENIQPCIDADDFAHEATWVILNSGMREQMARQIWNKIKNAWLSGKPTSSAFGHKGKVAAIDFIHKNRQDILNQYECSPEPLEFLESLPFIGKITKYHLAKNLGIDCVKPDRHLVRLAKEYNFDDCFKMCNKISLETGDKVSMVDMVLWRSANLGWI